MHWSLDIVRDLAGEETASRINEAQPDPTTPLQYELAFRNGRTGERLATLPFPAAREVSIRKLKKLLSEGIDIQVGNYTQCLEISYN